MEEGLNLHSFGVGATTEGRREEGKEGRREGVGVRVRTALSLSLSLSLSLLYLYLYLYMFS